MKLHTLLSLLTLSALAVAPAAFAKKPESAGKPAAEKTEVAGGVAKTDEAAAKAEDKAGDVKGLKRDEFKRLNAAREKAEADESVKAAFAKKAETQKAYAAAKKAGDTAAINETRKAQELAHAAWIKARRDAITKIDPEAGKLDAQVFDNMKAMREIKARKAAELAGDDAEKAEKAGKPELKDRPEGRGKDAAPGQLKKGEGKERGKGRKKDKGDGETEPKAEPKGDAMTE